MSGWRRITIGELIESNLAEVRTGPFGTQLRASDYTETGVPVLNVRNLGYGGIRRSDVDLVDRTVQARLSTHILRENDIVFGRKGAVDRHALIRPAEVGWMQGSDCIRLRLDKGAPVTPSFLSMALLTPTHKAWMEAQCSHGATMASLNQEIIARIELAVPDRASQNRIAATLAAVDELIAVNERRIELLETLARSLYREWFVRFRFSGHEDADGLPSGWQRRPASEVFEVNPRIRTRQATFPKVTMGDVDERFAIVFPSGEVSRASGSRFQRDDVLLARITPCLENGKTALVKFLEGDATGVGSTEFIVLRGHAVGPAFTYCAARSEPVREHAIKSMSGASGRQRVASNAFDSLELVRPSPAIAEEFERRAGPLLNEGFALARQNRALTRTRDLLLPRLVTGRLDISDIDLGDLVTREEAA